MLIIVWDPKLELALQAKTLTMVCLSACYQDRRHRGVFAFRAALNSVLSAQTAAKGQLVKTCFVGSNATINWDLEANFKSWFSILISTDHGLLVQT